MNIKSLLGLIAASHLVGHAAGMSVHGTQVVDAASAGLRMTCFNTTSFAPGDYAPGVTVTVVPAPITLGGESFVGNYQSCRLEGMLIAPSNGSYVLFIETEGGVRIWVDDHLVTNDGLHTLRNTSSMYPAILIAGRRTPLRIEYQHNVGNALLVLRWNVSGQPPVLVPAVSLSSDVRACDDARTALRDRLGVANPISWGTHWIDHVGMHVHLASRLGIPFTLGDPAKLAQLATLHTFGHNNPVNVRVGPHSLNGSDYTQVNVSAWQGRRCDVSFETAVARGGSDLLVLIASSGPDCVGLIVYTRPNMLWGGFGSYAVNVPGRIDVKRPGFKDVSVFAAQQLAPPFPLAGGDALTVALTDGGTIGFSVSNGGVNYSLSEISYAVKSARSHHAASFDRFGALAEVAEAIETTIAWNTVFSASECMKAETQGGLRTPQAGPHFHCRNCTHCNCSCWSIHAG